MNEYRMGKKILHAKHCHSGILFCFLLVVVAFIQANFFYPFFATIFSDSILASGMFCECIFADTPNEQISLLFFCCWNNGKQLWIQFNSKKKKERIYHVLHTSCIMQLNDHYTDSFSSFFFFSFWFLIFDFWQQQESCVKTSIDDDNRKNLFRFFENKTNWCKPQQRLFIIHRN